MLLSDEQKRQFREYCKANKEVYSDRVVQTFFQRDENIELLLEAHEGNQDSERELEERFRKHFFQIRFLKFLVSTIKYYTIDQIRLNQKNDMRYQLIFDCPSSDEGEATLGDMLCKHEIPTSETFFTEPSEFQDSFTNEELAKAFAVLTTKQQVIATLGYALCYQDNEISKIIGISPQSVGKTRNLALQRLRLAMPDRG
jgi:RNA polymerase sigma factor (sigma-70 family)